MPNVAAPRRDGADGPHRHAPPAAFADALDLHRHRQAALQARHPRLLRTHAGWARRPARDQPVRAQRKALWNILNQNGLRSVVIGWWPSHPAEPIDGVMVSDHFHRADRPGAMKAGRCCRMPSIRRNSARRLPNSACTRTSSRRRWSSPSFRWRVKSTRRRIHASARCCRTLAECISMHSAATWLLENKPWDFFAVYYDAIDHFCHGFMKYHPPRQQWIPERDFELYSGRRLDGLRVPRPDARHAAAKKPATTRP